MEPMSSAHKLHDDCNVMIVVLCLPLALQGLAIVTLQGKNVASAASKGSLVRIKR